MKNNNDQALKDLVALSGMTKQDLVSASHGYLNLSKANRLLNFDHNGYNPSILGKIFLTIVANSLLTKDKPLTTMVKPNPIEPFELTTMVKQDTILTTMVNVPDTLTTMDGTNDLLSTTVVKKDKKLPYRKPLSERKMTTMVRDNEAFATNDQLKEKRAGFFKVVKGSIYFIGNDGNLVADYHPDATYFIVIDGKRWTITPDSNQKQGTFKIS